MLELVGLRGREKERVEGYSRGMRQRLHIARGLLHDPPVVFLDEPTIGVDPVGARELRATIASLTESGKTVLLTTHYMFEADSLCDRIAVIARGEIVAEGTPQDLKSIVADKTVVEIETFGIAPETIDRLRQAPGVASVSVEEREQAQVLHVQSAKGLELTHELLAMLDGTASAASPPASPRSRTRTWPWSTRREVASRPRPGLADALQAAVALVLQQRARHRLPALLRDRRLLPVPRGQPAGAPVRSLGAS